MVVSLEPADESADLDAGETTLTVTFDRPMGGGMSWTHAFGRDKLPEGTGKPEWNADKTVCSVPVKLEPGREYALQLNAAHAINFQSEWGVPLEPVPWRFATSAK